MKISLIILILFLFSCSGSKKLEDQKEPKKKAELDALFGISDQEAQGDDELLTLLDNQRSKEPTKEIVLGENSTQKTESETEKPVEMKEATPDQSAKITELENTVKAQKDEIAMLRSENDRLTRENQDLMNRKPEVKVVYKDNANSSGDYENDYQNAKSLFDNREYQNALNAFEQLVALDPTHKLADNAQYWVGESRYALKQYQNAIQDFEKVFTFAQSNKNADAQFKLGLSYLKLKDYVNSKLELQRFVDRHPNNRNAERAQNLLATIN